MKKKTEEKKEPQYHMENIVEEHDGDHISLEDLRRIVVALETSALTLSKSEMLATKERGQEYYKLAWRFDRLLARLKIQREKGLLKEDFLRFTIVTKQWVHKAVEESKLSLAK